MSAQDHSSSRDRPSAGHFTPGPWVAREEPHRSAIFSASAYAGRHIATASSYWAGDGPRAEEREANARLMAAAPDMFEALKEVVAYLDSIEGLGEGGTSAYDVPSIMARAAIAKAEGRS